MVTPGGSVRVVNAAEGSQQKKAEERVSVAQIGGGVNSLSPGGFVAESTPPPASATYYLQLPTTSNLRPLADNLRPTISCAIGKKSKMIRDATPSRL